MLPLLFLLALTLAKVMVDAKPFWERVVDVGWDMCILGIGLAAGLFGDQGYITRVGGQKAVFTTSSVIAVDLIFAIGILLIMKAKRFTGIFGTASAFLGILAVAVPCFLLLWR